MPDAITPPPDPRVPESEVELRAAGTRLAGTLWLPDAAIGLVAFVHGSGSSRFSPRNRRVAETLRERSLATLLLDLLTPSEEDLDTRTGSLRFDIAMLGERVSDVVTALAADPTTSTLPLGLFGASTGAAAALHAAAAQPESVAAVVSRGGRPDLALEDLPRVRAPTLLIVGELDLPVVEMNRAALSALSGTKELALVPGATHLFEEPGALDEVCERSGAWFTRHLRRYDGDVDGGPR